MKLSKDKTSLIYSQFLNQFLTLSGIPPETYEYRLGNRPLLNGSSTDTKSRPTSAAGLPMTRIGKMIRNTFSGSLGRLLPSVWRR
jgi:hypothetical protein